VDAPRHPLHRVTDRRSSRLGIPGWTYAAATKRFAPGTHELRGLIQRIADGILFAWMLAASMRLRRISR